MERVSGQVVQIRGGVVDCEFPPGNLPEIYDAIEVMREGQNPLILEVQLHLGDRLVRTVAMDTTDGLRRGTPVEVTGSPTRVPVGESTLGRGLKGLGVPAGRRRS